MRFASASRWVIAYTCAVAGDACYFVVLTWAAAAGGGPRTSGLILAAGAMPRALLMLPGGVLADRVSPRRLALTTDAARCVLMLGASVLAGTLGLTPWWLAAIAIAFGCIDAVFMPAVGAMPPRLVPREGLARLQAWRIGGLRVSNTVGPAAGAFLIAQGGPLAFAVIAALFGGSVALLMSVRLRTPVPEQEGEGNARVGFRSIWRQLRDHGLHRLVVGTALSELPFNGAVAIGIVLLTRQQHWPAEAAGGILAAFSVGGLVASVAGATLPGRLIGKPTLVGSTLASAVLLVTLARTPSVILAVTNGGVLGLTTGLTMVVCHGTIQETTPPGLLGRVTGLLTLLTLGISPILYAAAGAIAAALTVRPFFYGAAVIIAIATIVLATTSRRSDPNVSPPRLT